MTIARSLSLTLAVAVVAMGATMAAHERKEVAGLDVVFGAEPEPALTGEMQFLRSGTPNTGTVFRTLPGQAPAPG